MRFALNQPLASLEGPGLRRCVTLALLLHLLVIILFGSAPAGMALRGDGVWGRLSVSLTGGETPSKVPTASLEAYKAQGEPQRSGGSQREAGSPRAMAPQQATAAPAPREALSPENSAQPGDAALPALTAMPELPQPTAMPAAALPAQSTLAPPTAALRRLSSESRGRPRVEGAAHLSAIGAAAEQAVQPISPDLPVADSAKPIAPITPARIVTLSEIAAPPTSRQEPVQAMAPAASEPVVAKLAPLQPLQPLQPLEGNTLPLSPSGSLAGTTPQLAGPVAAEAKPSPAAAPPVATAPLAPRLNLNLPRGGETSRGASQGLLQMLPRPPERPSRLAEEVARAAKKDCRQAYSGMGLLAVVPLVAGAVKGDGCNW